MKSGAVVREILWEIEKSVAKTKSDEVPAVSTNSQGPEVIKLFSCSTQLSN